MDACPICGDHGGFHDEEVHSARPLPEGTALPLPETEKSCRACGHLLSSAGDPDCRYPKHGQEG